jgi:hypothetical protein
MNKNTQHGDGVGVQVVKFNLISIEHIEKKLGRRDVKSATEESLKNYELVLDLAGRESLTRCHPPFD